MANNEQLIQERLQYLRENTDVIPAIFDRLISYAIITADFDGQILSFNKGAQQIYGYAPEEVIGQLTLESFFTEEFYRYGKMAKLVEDLMADGFVSYEGEKIRKNGSAFPADVLYTLTLDNNGHVAGFIEIVRDLTAQKQYETTLKEGEERLRQVIEHVADCMLIVDFDGFIRYLNPAAETLFGRPAQELLDGVFGFPIILGEKMEIEIVRPRPAAPAIAEMLLSELNWWGSRAYLAILRDITTRKKAELEMERKNQELEISNRELDDFAYIASHDLREPLRGIINFSAFLMEDYADKLDEAGRSKLETLMRLANREEKLIQALLDYSRIGRIELALDKVDLNAVIADISESVKISFQNDDIDITIPRLLPTVLCDRVRINAVFANLVANALKYNESKKKIIEIGYLKSAQASGKRTPSKPGNPIPADQTIYYVKDNGIGIRESHQDKIFTIFKRLHAQDKYGGGTGIGLTIVKKIIALHRGSIWLESTVGEGTTFYFTLSGEGDTKWT